jgi:hypothetical protein
MWAFAARYTQKDQHAQQGQASQARFTLWAAKHLANISLEPVIANLL